jgi:hypothetical protein
MSNLILDGSATRAKRYVDLELRAMHLQNRVTPFADIVAIPQRGIFTGNRGIIHDPQTKTLLNKRWTNKAWLICSCEYKGRQRKVMGRQTWTELFFLDEAVALAAGHRPCFLCRREAASAFRAAWARAQGCPQPTAAELGNKTSAGHACRDRRNCIARLCYVGFHPECLFYERRGELR